MCNLIIKFIFKHLKTRPSTWLENNNENLIVTIGNTLLRAKQR